MRESTGYYILAQMWLIGALLERGYAISYFMGGMALIWFVAATLMQRKE